MKEFALYKHKATRFSILYLIGLVIVLIVLFIFKDEINLQLVFAGIVVLVLIYAITENKQKSIGTIKLDNHEITLLIKNDITLIKLSNVKKLEMIYSGYSGKRLRQDLIPRYNKFSGTDNYITIENDDVIFKFKFLVEDLESENDLIQIINNWEANAYDISEIKFNL